MSNVTLAIRHLRDEQMLLRQGGLYWVVADQVGDAAALAIQCLAAMPAQARASLLCCGHDSQTLAQALSPDNGPGELALFDIKEVEIGLALASLTGELTRTIKTTGSIIVLMLPADAWKSGAAPPLHQWFHAMRQWLTHRRSTLLVISHGQSPQLHSQLLRMNEMLSGLAQLYRRDGGVRYQLNYWLSDLGVCSGQELDVVLDEQGFALSADARTAPQLPHADDQRIYLTQRLALGGAPALSDQWRLFEHRDELLAQARHARAASVIVAIDSNLQVEGLARQLHDLRECCGNSLKIIVREIEPCLRYRDERLLVSCGANITVPHGTPLAHFISIIDSVQGQIWRHSRNTDFQSLFERLRPPAERGLMTPSEFLHTVTRIYSGASDEISHQLLKLTPRGGLGIEQYLSQVSLRRYGDIACVVEGDFYLFLFACRVDGLEPALSNICRLAWRDMFSKVQVLPGVDALPHSTFLNAVKLPATFHLAQERTAGGLDQLAEHIAYSPKRTALPITDACL